jgi:hypothetical protein
VSLLSIRRCVTTDLSRTAIREIRQRVERANESIPAQILWQQPVHFLDASNRRWPLHLDFITSWRFFLAVLELKLGEKSREKIRKREFYLRESATRHRIDIDQDWSHCFSPGQAIDMMMTFELAGILNSDVCQACGFEAVGNVDESSEW